MAQAVSPPATEAANGMVATAQHLASEIGVDSLKVGGNAVAATAVIAPFSARYQADWKSINVGTSDLELKQDGNPGHYVYTWRITARGVRAGRVIIRARAVDAAGNDQLVVPEWNRRGYGGNFVHEVSVRAG